MPFYEPILSKHVRNARNGVKWIIVTSYIFNLVVFIGCIIKINEPPFTISMWDATRFTQNHTDTGGMPIPVVNIQYVNVLAVLLTVSILNVVIGSTLFITASMSIAPGEIQSVFTLDQISIFEGLIKSVSCDTYAIYSGANSFGNFFIGFLFVASQFPLLFSIALVAGVRNLSQIYSICSLGILLYFITRVMKGRKLSLLLARLITTAFVLGFMWYDVIYTPLTNNNSQTRIVITTLAFGTYTIYLLIVPWFIWDKNRILEQFERHETKMAFRYAQLASIQIRNEKDPEIGNTSIRSIAHAADTNVANIKRNHLPRILDEEVWGLNTIIENIEENDYFYRCCKRPSKAADRCSWYGFSCFKCCNRDRYTSNIKIMRDQLIQKWTKNNKSYQLNGKNLNVAKEDREKINNHLLVNFDWRHALPEDLLDLDDITQYTMVLRYLQMLRYHDLIWWDSFFCATISFMALLMFSSFMITGG